MGIYLNPGNSEFARILRGDYVDKTGLISLMNERMDTDNGLICISRPRRFGKSYAARMLCAYYDYTCDSHKLFEPYEISRHESYEKYLNQYQIICLDMAQILNETNDVVAYIKQKVTEELLAAYPDLKVDSAFSITLVNAVEHVGKKIIMIIDEWDAPVRETPELAEDYLYFLRTLFKSINTTAKTFAAAYMTGILPIKKDGSQSAISNFREFSVLSPGKFAQYTGFTEQEVRELCKKKDMDFDEAKKWYDGYSFAQSGSVYNPFSVMMAMESGEYESYWKRTSAADPLLTYINIHIQKQDGQKSTLGEDILKLIAGEQLKVNVSRFNNDFQTFRSEDDVLTLLIHLGYLVYDKDTKRVRIPNEEVRMEFNELLEEPQHTSLTSLILQSEQLLSDTLAGNEQAVADAIRQIRETNYAPAHYNNEQSLRYVVKFAYIVCVDRYLKVEELPSGKGLADVVYLPKQDTALPAMMIELKWNETANSAINQIKKRNYPAVLKDYAGEVVLVGINYSSKTNKHTCRIERITI